jgi:hypothetical protein
MPRAGARPCGEQVPDAVAHHEAVRLVDTEPAGQEQVSVGLGPLRHVAGHDWARR